MCSIVILTIGATAVAGLAGVMLSRGRQSKYMTLAATLASEKLEDLSHWPSAANITTGADTSAPQICVPFPATTEGSLVPTATANATISCGSYPATAVSYFDDVSLDIVDGSNCANPGAGCFAETTSTVINGTTTYFTTFHSPDGQIAPPAVNGTTSPPTYTSFHRVWLIEANTPTSVTSSAGIYIPGTRRVTVLVTLLDQSVQPGVSYQMSMVRP
jgi:hypothetical protein